MVVFGVHSFDLRIDKFNFLKRNDISDWDKMTNHFKSKASYNTEGYWFKTEGQGIIVTRFFENYTMKKTNFRGASFFLVSVYLDNLTNNRNCTERNFSKIKFLLSNYYWNVFGNEVPFEDFRLHRIDYYFDFKVNHINIYIDLIKRLNVKFQRCKKTTECTGVTYKCDSYRIIIYDRYEKSKSRCESEEDLEYNKDRLRFELQVHSPKLRTMKKQYGLMAELGNFFNDKEALFHLQNYFKKLIPSGNHYSHEIALAKLHSACLRKELSRRTCRNLVYYLNTINGHGEVNQVPKSRQTIQCYTKLLASRGINPLTLNYKNDGVPVLPGLLEILNGL